MQRSFTLGLTMRTQTSLDAKPVASSDSTGAEEHTDRDGKRGPGLEVPAGLQGPSVPSQGVRRRRREPTRRAATGAFPGPPSVGPPAPTPQGARATPHVLKAQRTARRSLKDPTRQLRQARWAISMGPVSKVVRARGESSDRSRHGMRRVAEAGERAKVRSPVELRAGEGVPFGAPEGRIRARRPKNPVRPALKSKGRGPGAVGARSWAIGLGRKPKRPPGRVACIGG